MSATGASETAASVAGFVLGYAWLVVLPGVLLTGLLCRTARPLERWTFALVLGMVSSALFYWLAQVIDRPDSYHAWPAATAVLIAMRRRELLDGLFARPGASHALLAVAVCGSLGVLVTLPAFSSLKPRSDGTMVRPFGDFEFHLAIVKEAMNTVPPQSPFTAGAPLRYHYAPDLTAALLARAARIAPHDLVLRLLPALYLVQTMLAIFCVLRSWLNASNIAGLVAGLTVLAGDLGWLVGVFCPELGSSSITVFSTPTFVSLFSGNPMLPALSVFFGGLLAVEKACRTREWRWVCVASVLLGALMQYKVFAGIHVAAALAVSAAWGWIEGRATTLMKIAALVGTWTAGSLALAKVGHQVSPQDFIWAPLWLLDATAAAMCFLPRADTMAHWAPLGRLALLMAVVAPLYVLGSFGPRLLGWGPFVDSLRGADISDDRHVPFQRLLALFVILGVMATAVGRVTPRDAQGIYNNSVWFLVQSKYVMWMFAACALVRIVRRSRTQAVVAGIVVCALGLPSLFTWVSTIRQMPMSILDPEQVALVRVLEPACAGGATVFAPPPGSDEPSYATGRESEILLLAGCRVLLVEPFASNLISQDDWKRRRMNMLQFWKSWRKGWLRNEILERYDARYVVELVGENHRPFTGLRPIFAGSRYFAYSVPGRETASIIRR